MGKMISQAELTWVDENGMETILHPINTAPDVNVGTLEEGDLTPPGENPEETLQDALKNLRKICKNIRDISKTYREVSNKVEHDSEVDIPTSKITSTLNKNILAVSDRVTVLEDDIKTKAPIDHASTETKYGIGTTSKYGHVKTSDVYATSEADGSARQAKAASQNALFSAYDSLNKAKAPNNHAVNAETYGKGTSALYGHVKTSNIYDVTSTDDSEVATRKALHDAYAELKSVNDTQDTEIAKKAPTSHASSATTYGVGTTGNYGHLKISDSFNSDNSTTGAASNGVAASSWAVYRAYSTLKTAVDGKLASGHADEKATGSKWSHVKLSDNYTSSAGAASSGIGASSLAVYNAYNSLNTAIVNLTTIVNGKAASGHTHGYLVIDNTTVATEGRLQYLQSSSNSENPNTDWYSVIRAQHPGYVAGYWQELALSFHADKISYRRNENGTKSNWRDLAWADHNHSDYLPKSGGRMDSSLHFNNITTGERGVIFHFGDNDTGGIVAVGTGNDIGYVDIFSTDNGTEPIYVSQYASGNAIDQNLSGRSDTPSRRLTLLDENGNTAIPGTLDVGGRDVNGRARTVRDSGDGRTLTFNYSAAGLSSCDWVAAWNGNELRGISPANLKSAMGITGSGGGSDIYAYTCRHNFTGVRNGTSNYPDNSMDYDCIQFNNGVMILNAQLYGHLVGSPYLTINFPVSFIYSNYSVLSDHIPIEWAYAKDFSHRYISERHTYSGLADVKLARVVTKDLNYMKLYRTAGMNATYCYDEWGYNQLVVTVIGRWK